MSGDFEKAELEFMEALKEEKYPNYRHKLMTYQWLADNYKQHAETFGLRMDLTSQVYKLEKALEMIQKALNIDEKDIKLWNTYRNICIDLGITLCKKKGFSEGKLYLEKSIQTKQFGNKKIVPYKEIAAAAYFYLAALSINDNYKEFEQIDNWITLGLINCSTSSKFFEKLNELKRNFNRKHGRIKYFNSIRKYGLIEITDKEYLFFPSGFRNRIKEELLYRIDGKEISCVLTESLKKKGTMIAIDIVFEKK